MASPVMSAFVFVKYDAFEVIGQISSWVKMFSTVHMNTQGQGLHSGTCFIKKKKNV